MSIPQPETYADVLRAVIQGMRLTAAESPDPDILVLRFGRVVVTLHLDAGLDAIRIDGIPCPQASPFRDPRDPKVVYASFNTGSPTR